MLYRFSLLCFALSLSHLMDAQSPTGENPTIRVLSFNILHGANTDGSFDLDAIANVILKVNPDFVALQEVDYKTNRAHKYDLVTELGYRTKMSPLFGRAMYFDGGEYGEGLLSKYSFAKTRNLPLPFTLGNEPRAALEGVVVLPSGDTISIIGTHLDHLDDATDRIQPARSINTTWAKTKYPTILAGDLNAQPGSRTIKIFESFWTASYDKESPKLTYSSKVPDKKIDYVMHYPEQAWSVVNTEAICDPIASDHCAYLAVLEMLK